jgi:hypothetical protein
MIPKGKKKINNIYLKLEVLVLKQFVCNMFVKKIFKLKCTNELSLENIEKNESLKKAQYCQIENVAGSV